MARPQKNGLDYFALDVVMNDEVEIIEAEHGLEGFAILIKLFQKIYSEGYYYEWGDKEQILFSNRVSVDRNKVTSIVSDCIKWNIFNEALYKRYGILTSRRIQNQYITSTYKRTNVEIIEEYLLIDISDRTNLVVTRVSDIGNEDTSIDTDIQSTQSKVKKSKVKKSILNTTTKDKGACSGSSSKDSGADEPINDLSKIAVAFQSNGFGTINITVKETLLEFLELYSTEWIMEAMKIAVEANKRSLRYVKGILENWTRSGGMKLTADKGAGQYHNSNSIPVKKTRFHNFESRSQNYSDDQIEEIIARKRREDREKRQGEIKLPKIIEK